MTDATAETEQVSTTQQKPNTDVASNALDATLASISDAPDAAPKGLTFTSDKGASRSTWIAAFLVLAIVGWMSSGLIIPSEDTAPMAAREAPKPVAVAVTTSVAETVTQFYQAEGQALPDRDTLMRAEISGDIAEVFLNKGQDVAAGDIIARLERGVSTADRVSTARAMLAAAQARVTAVEQAAKALTVTAPFAGRIETLDLDAGEFVSAGTDVGRLVDITPLTVAIQVPQQSLTRITVGQSATVSFITGEERTGTVTFVGTSAASETRTFLAEIEVANEDGAIPAGISAEVNIPTGEATAHFLSASIVSLDTEGTLGVKTVNAENLVAFYPIQVVKAQIDGIWVTGLPATVEVITVGQGFVNEDETVAPSAGEQSQ
jgi:multidrug efflux system membrane fusion protein